MSCKWYRATSIYIYISYPNLDFIKPKTLYNHSGTRVGPVEGHFLGSDGVSQRRDQVSTKRVA